MLVNLSTTVASDGSSLSDKAPVGPRADRSSLWASLLAVAIYCASVAIVWPAVELATDDDFAYARMALQFARTGHFVFNGWETAMVGWQVAWGALFIHLFGYSYLTLRLSVIVLGALLTLLLHRILLRSGVTGSAAVLGTLTVVLSPLFLPMVTSYMTDVPALLCVLLVFYGCQRALRAGSDHAALAWLCGSAALNVLDGTVRQIAWLGALVIVPSGFWLLRNRRGFKTVGIITWLISLIAIVSLMIWFSHQPYALPEHIIRGAFTGLVIRHILRLCFYGPLEVLCFSLPVLIAWIFELRTLSRRKRLQLVALCTLITPFLLVAAHFDQVQGRLPPWFANTVGRYGILWSVPLPGERPAVLPSSITSVLAVVLIASLLGLIIWLKRDARRDLFNGSIPEQLSHRNELSPYETCVLILPFSVAYFCLLLPRAAFPSVFSAVWDRYFTPLIFVAVLLLLRLLKERQREIPVTCYAVLLLFSFFSVAATHDLFVTYRTIASIRAHMQATGVAPAVISGPWEEDGANQINLQGYLNDPRIRNPPDAYHRVMSYSGDQCNFHFECYYEFSELLPALHFRYVLTVEKLGCLVPPITQM